VLCTLWAYANHVRAVTISDLAGGDRDRLRAYPRREVPRFLLESPSIQGDFDGDDRLRMVCQIIRRR
jgi:hypothetical protein